MIQVTNGGSIVGTVKLAGSVPTRPPLKVTKNQNHCGTSIPDPTYIVGGDGGLANVEVYLKTISRGKAPPAEGITIANSNCMFDPRVQAGIAGGSLKITNTDDHAHNTHVRINADNSTLGNFALPFKGFALAKPMPTTPGLLNVKCDIHEWMKAWVWVFDHPYFATTKIDGKFEITGVPPGNYVLVAWHEAAGQTEQPVTVVAGKPAAATFTFNGK